MPFTLTPVRARKATHTLVTTGDRCNSTIFAGSAQTILDAEAYAHASTRDHVRLEETALTGASVHLARLSVGWNVCLGASQRGVSRSDEFGTGGSTLTSYHESVYAESTVVYAGDDIGYSSNQGLTDAVAVATDAEHVGYDPATGRFVAGGTLTPFVRSSADGISWSSSTGASSGETLGFASDGTRLVRAYDALDFDVSVNGGQNWSAGGFIDDSGSLIALGYDSDRAVFVAVRSYATAPEISVYTSPDGVTWTVVSTTALQAGTNHKRSGSFDNGIVYACVLVGSILCVARSFDLGVTWEYSPVVDTGTATPTYDGMVSVSDGRVAVRAYDGGAAAYKIYIGDV